MFGRRAGELVEELRRSKWLPPYNDAEVRYIAAEMKEVLSALTDIFERNKSRIHRDLSISAGVLVFHRTIQRNKRCILAYLMNRLRRIQAYRWEAGASAMSDLEPNLGGLERDFLNKYNKLLEKYSENVDLDLTTDLQPPKDLYIEVRVLKDQGSILTDSGETLILQAGSAHYVKRSDVELLIRQGVLEHVT